MASRFLPGTTQPYLEPARNLGDSVARLLRRGEARPVGEPAPLPAGVATSEPGGEERDSPLPPDIRTTLPYRRSDPGDGAAAPTVPAPASEDGAPRATPAVEHAANVRRVGGPKLTLPYAEPVVPPVEAARPVEVRIVDSISRTSPAPTMGEECEAMDEHLRQLIRIVRGRR